MSTTYQGIDYGLGKTNVDKDAGIRYGVISANDLPFWYDEAESFYGNPHCPKCGNDATAYTVLPEEIDDSNWEQAECYCVDYFCLPCKYLFGSESAFPEEPHSMFVDDKDCQAEQSGDDGDVFVFKSDYFTYAQFCSPCAPGACYLISYLEPLCPKCNEKTEVDGQMFICHEHGSIWHHSEVFPQNNKAYCPPLDWFEDEKPPFPIFSVETDTLLYYPNSQEEE